MADIKVREGSNEPIEFSSLQRSDATPVDISTPFFQLVIADKNNTPTTWDRTNDINNFTVAPGGVTDKLVFHPPKLHFRKTLEEYNAYLWIKDGTEWVSVGPAGADHWTIAVKSALGVLPGGS